VPFPDSERTYQAEPRLGRDDDDRGDRSDFVMRTRTYTAGTQLASSSIEAFLSKTEEKYMSGKSDKAEGKTDKVAGKIKEETGDLLDDKDLETRGKAQKVKGDLKERKGHLKDAAR
jgi:uncharacterized protein YjbJ (UPF0337 family)